MKNASVQQGGYSWGIRMCLHGAGRSSDAAVGGKGGGAFVQGRIGWLPW